MQTQTTWNKDYKKYKDDKDKEDSNRHVAEQLAGLDQKEGWFIAKIKSKVTERISASWHYGKLFIIDGKELKYGLTIGELRSNENGEYQDIKIEKYFYHYKLPQLRTICGKKSELYDGPHKEIEKDREAIICGNCGITHTQMEEFIKTVTPFDNADFVPAKQKN